MNKTQLQSRRHFLKKLALGVGSASVLATQTKLQLMQSAMAMSSDYSDLNDHKSLVCVFLYGGNDSFNTVIPYEQNAYNQYQDVRSRIALERDTLLPLKGDEYALHPSMPDLQALFNQDDVAVMGNIGALIETTTRGSFQDGSARLPADLFSHNHQQEFWQTGASSSGSTPPGWGGRMMDLLSTANADLTGPASFSLAGNNAWQIGEKPLNIALNPKVGVEKIEGFVSEIRPRHIPGRVTAWNEILQQNSSSLFQQEFANTHIKAEERISTLFDQFSLAPELDTFFTAGDRFSQTMSTVAKMISIRENLGMKRQTFFVGLGGWDFHANQLPRQAQNLATLNAGLSSFYNATDSLGIKDSVTTFTASDFGRSLSINGKGTDHGWTGHHLIMGGAVKGGNVYGEMPQLILNGPDDARNTGRLIPKNSMDQYGATMGKWMGMSESDLEDIFPNLTNFERSSYDLGFMS